jgi:hypothetical protein
MTSSHVENRMYPYKVLKSHNTNYQKELGANHSKMNFEGQSCPIEEHTMML